MAEQNISLAQRNEPLGGAIYLLLFYFLLEYVRPVNPLGMPLAISLVLFIWWMTLERKIWTPQVVCLYLLVAAIAVMGPFADNNYAIWIGFRSMVAWLLCISIPMICFANSLRKIRVLINALIALHVYLGLYAVLHGGFGTGGFLKDENDAALAINTMLPLAFFSALTAQTIRGKLLYLAAVVSMVAGVVATNSRGGFVGLVAVVIFCFLISPRKKLGLTIGAVLLSIGLLVAPEQYWTEMGTIVPDALDSEWGTGGQRLRFWGVAMDMFLSNPLFGVGLNNFEYNVKNYVPAELWENDPRRYLGQAAHSVYFTILSETGAAGALLVAAITYFSVRSIRSILTEARRMEALANVDGTTRANLLAIRGLAYGLGGGMFGYGVSGIFLTAFAYPNFWYVVALVVALENVTGQLVVALAGRQPLSGPQRTESGQTVR